MSVRHARSVLLLLVLPVLLVTGCMSVDLNTTVSSQGTFTGEYRTMLDKESLRNVNVSSLQEAQQQFGTGSGSEGVEVSWSETDTDYVQTVTFTDATPQQIEDAAGSSTTESSSTGTLVTSTSTSFPLAATPQGDTMVVTLSDSAEQAAQSAAPSSGTEEDRRIAEQFVKQMFGDASISMTITMPGQIQSVTGAIPDLKASIPGITLEQPDGNTVVMKAGVVALIDAQAKAAAGAEALVITSQLTSGTGAADTSSPVGWFIVLGIAVLAVIGIVVAIIVVRRRSAEQ